jgi:hypothetical protein
MGQVYQLVENMSRNKCSFQVLSHVYVLYEFVTYLLTLLVYIISYYNVTVR